MVVMLERSDVVRELVAPEVVVILGRVRSK